MTDKTEEVSRLLASIARSHFPQLADRGFVTLEPKNSDGLDFLDASVWAIKSALEEAYNCGYADAEQAHGVQD